MMSAVTVARCLFFSILSCFLLSNFCEVIAYRRPVVLSKTHHIHWLFPLLPPLKQYMQLNNCTTSVLQEEQGFLLHLFPCWTPTLDSLFISLFICILYITPLHILYIFILTHNIIIFKLLCMYLYIMFLMVHFFFCSELHFGDCCLLSVIV